MDKEVKTRLLIFGAVVLFFGLWLFSSNQSQKIGIISDIPQLASAPTPVKSDKNSNGCYTTDLVRSHYGETGCVEFTVGYTYETRAGTKFIDEKVNYKDGFVVYVPRDSNFSTVDLESLQGKKIRVTGLITEYNGYPQIEATDYSQVKVLK